MDNLLKLKEIKDRIENQMIFLEGHTEDVSFKNEVEWLIERIEILQSKEEFTRNYNVGDIVKVKAEKLNRKSDSFTVIQEIHNDFFYDNRNGYYTFDEVELVCPNKERYDVKK